MGDGGTTEIGSLMVGRGLPRASMSAVESIKPVSYVWARPMTTEFREKGPPQDHPWWDLWRFKSDTHRHGYHDFGVVWLYPLKWSLDCLIVKNRIVLYRSCETDRSALCEDSYWVLISVIAIQDLVYWKSFYMAHRESKTKQSAMRWCPCSWIFIVPSCHSRMTFPEQSRLSLVFSFFDIVWNSFF